MKKSILLVSFVFLGLSGYCQVEANAGAVATTSENPSTTEAIATPIYPGGNGAFLKFIETNIVYPEKAREEKTEGQVIVHFLVDVDGSVKKAVVPVGKGIGNGCDEAAIKVVMSSKNWQPGVKNGSAVPVWYEVPISFALAKRK